jgi:hypothetical protein
MFKNIKIALSATILCAFLISSSVNATNYVSLKTNLLSNMLTFINGEIEVGLTNSITFSGDYWHTENMHLLYSASNVRGLLKYYFK